MAGYVDGFVGIAGAFRGLRSCGTYPFNVATTTCGSWGLSLGSPLIASLAGQRFGARMYSIKSWSDQVVCPLGHSGLLTNTASTQADLVK